MSIIPAVPTASAGARAFAWAGAAVFALSLGYFLFSYAVTFGETATGAFTLRAAIIDTALFAAFALHHSVFARLPVRAWMAQRVSPLLERTVYVWVASLVLIAVCALWQPLPGVVWQLQPPWAWLLHGVQIAGIVLTLRSATAIDIWELAGIRQATTPARESQRNGAAIHPGHQTEWEFTTAGPYGWVRHPIYLGWLLIVFGVGTMTMTRLAFAVISAVYILVAMPLEERTLLRLSHGAYASYMTRVRRRIIPGVY